VPRRCGDVAKALEQTRARIDVRTAADADDDVDFGLPHRPGIELLPTCSMAIAVDPSVALILPCSAVKMRGQRGS